VGLLDELRREALDEGAAEAGLSEVLGAGGPEQRADVARALVRAAGGAAAGGGGVAARLGAVLDTILAVERCGAAAGGGRGGGGSAEAEALARLREEACSAAEGGGVRLAEGAAALGACVGALEKSIAGAWPLITSSFLHDQHLPLITSSFLHDQHLLNPSARRGALRPAGRAAQ